MATSVLSKATVPSLRAAASQGSSRVKDPTPADVSQSVATVADASGSLHAVKSVRCKQIEHAWSKVSNDAVTQHRLCCC